MAHLLAPGAGGLRLVEAAGLCLGDLDGVVRRGQLAPGCRLGDGACRGGGNSGPTCRGCASRAQDLPRWQGGRQPPKKARGSARSCGLRLRWPPSRRGPAGTAADCRHPGAQPSCSRSSMRGHGAPCGRSGCARVCRGRRTRLRRSAGHSWRHTATPSACAMVEPRSRHPARKPARIMSARHLAAPQISLSAYPDHRTAQPAALLQRGSGHN